MSSLLFFIDKWTCYLLLIQLFCLIYTNFSFNVLAAKMLACSFQDEGPNDRKIGKLCEYISKNPMRVPKVYSPDILYGLDNFNNEYECLFFVLP
jgi:hypothetical protein